MKNLIIILIVLLAAQTGFGQEKDLPQNMKLDTITCIGDSMLFLSETYIEKSLITQCPILYIVEHKKRKSYIKNVYYHGDYREWYKNGKLKSVGEYTFGTKTGEWEYWDNNGLRISENEAMGVAMGCGEANIIQERVIELLKKDRKIKRKKIK